MLRSRLYRALVRLPAYKGKGRVDAWAWGCLFPNPVFTLPGGMRMRLDPVEWAQRDLLQFDGAEPLTAGLLRRLLDPGSTFVDVGCHIGYHTLVALSAVGPAGRVVAVDPQPYNAERALENCTLNGYSNVVVYVAALGRTEDTIDLPLQPVSDRSRLSLLDRPAGAGPRFVVPVLRLEAVMRREGLDAVRVLKIDTEGYETEVLGGAGPALGNVENVILEILPDAQASRVDALVQVLARDCGMALFTVEGKPWSAGDRLPENNLWAARHRA